MNVKTLHLAFLTSVLYLLAATSYVFCQQPPGALADAHSPSGPPGPMQSASVWHVDPVTGALTVNIPVVPALPGGRGKHYSRILMYNSSSTATLQFYTIYNQNALYRWYGADSSPNPSGPAPHGPWQWNNPSLYSNNSTIPSEELYQTLNGVQTPVGYYNGCNLGGPYLYQDGEGSIHDLNLSYVQLDNPSSENPTCLSAINAPIGQTYDSSAIAGSLNNSVPTAIEPDGTTITSTGNIEDSNGNKSATTDSEGRVLLTPTGSCSTGFQLPSGNSSCTYTATDSNGSTLNYSVTAQTVTLGSFTMPHPTSTEVNLTAYVAPSNQVSNGVLVDVQNPSGTHVTGITQVSYPDGTKYGFTYDPVYGTINSITFPTGGSVQFTWGIRTSGESTNGVSAQSTLVVTKVSLSSSAGNTSTWNYSYQNLAGGSLASTETAPDGTVIKHTAAQAFYYSSVFTLGSPTFQETLTDTTSAGGAHLRSVATKYFDGSTAIIGYGKPSQIVTTYYDLPSVMQQCVQFSYDQWDNIIEKDESDLYPYSSTMCNVPSGSWLRKTFTTYPTSFCGSGNYPACANGTPANFAAAHIVNKPSQIEVTDGSGNPYSIAQYGYDEYSLSGSSGILNHDDTNYSVTMQSGRGNLTTESKCASVSAGSCASWLKTTHKYDLTGQMVSTTDPKGNLTQYFYSDSYSEGTPSSQTNSYLTQVIHAKTSLIDNYTYDYFTGRQTSHKDWNNQTTTYSYVDPSSGTADPFARLRQIVLPLTIDGTFGNSGHGTTTYTYTDVSGSFAIEEQHAVDTGGTTTTSTKYFDGLGREIRSSTITPQCGSGIQVLTGYDVMGRVSSVTNPYCSTSDPTYGFTSYLYDALGRKTQITLPDGSLSLISYAGTAMETTDPFNGSTNVQHIQQSDGLGRLTSVCEVAASLGSGTATACGLQIPGTGYLTTYTFDPLNNMRNVNQHGLQRSFTYDAMSRLLTSLNPEVGTDTYTYSNSNSAACVGDTSDPCTRTDARGVITTYSYDAMNRLYGKSYSVASSNSTGPISDLSSCFDYDTVISGSTDSNPLGQLTADWQQSGTCPATPPASIPSGALAVRIHSMHDAMGRSGKDQQCLSNTSCSATLGNFVYSYNLMGSPVQSNNGIFANTVSATQTASASGNGTTVTDPSITWSTTYDMALHIKKSVVQDQPSTTYFPTNTFSLGPVVLQPLSNGYDPFGHMIAAQKDIYNGTAAVSMLRQYDNRGRIYYEVDNGAQAASSATNSIGAIVIRGNEQGPTYPASSYAHATVTIGGTEGDQTFNPCLPVTSCPQTIPDSGTVTVTVNGVAVSVGYSLYSTSAQLATNLAAGINGAVSGVRATVSGSVITIRTQTPGTAGNGTGSLSKSVTSNESQYYPTPSFSASLSSSTFTGGTNASQTVYDSGTVTATINNVVASVSYNSSSTAQSIASGLSTAIQSLDGSFLTAKTDGDVSVLVSTTSGTSADYAVSTSVIYDSADFNSSSFTAVSSPMVNGDASDPTNGLVYYYYVPQGGYAPNGNILVHSDYVMGDWYFNYDAADRLVSATPDWAVPAQYQNKYGCWTYDAFGNRASESFSTTACNSSPPFTSWANYNSANNRFTTTSYATAGVTYDASGNLLYDGNNKYWYDAEGQLCAMQSLVGGPGAVIQYVYDAEGARIAKSTVSAAPGSIYATCAPPLGSGSTVTGRYLVDSGGNQVTELNGTGAWQHSNIWAGGTLTATYDTKGIHMELADPLGTKRVQVNASGVIDESCMSLPFGDDVQTPSGPYCVLSGQSTSDDATEHHFTQKEHDGESSNDYFLARYYTSSMGRFMSPDWSAKVAPVPYAIFTEPQSLNLYAYVRNNPLIRADADGHTCKSGDWGCNLWDTAAAAWNSIHQIRQDAKRLVQSGTVKGELGFGVKGHVKAGPIEAHLGVSIHDEKTYGAQDKKLTDGTPITDKAEADAGIKIGTFGGGGEVGFKHTGGDDAPIERYGPEPEASAEPEGGGKFSGDGNTMSFGITGYAIIGGGITFTVDQEALLDVVKDIPSAADALASSLSTQH